MSAWLFDLGNSRLKCAPLQAGVPGPVLDVGHDGENFVSDWTVQFPECIDHAYVSSVASPTLTAALLDGLTQRCPRISLARTQRVCDGVHIAYDTPRNLGVDRFLTLLAAHARGHDTWLVVGVGTALTIDLLDAAGRHHGGRIAPAPTLMREALHARAPQLPSSGGAYTEFAKDTAAGLASGCEGAALALIAHSRDVAATQLSHAPRVLLHGGGAPALRDRIDDAVFAPALVLEGLARWAHAVTSPTADNARA